MAFLDEILQFRKEEQSILLIVCSLVRILFVPASVGTCMAHRTHRIGLDEQGVLIAVVENLNNVEEVARSLALGPECIASA